MDYTFSADERKVIENMTYTMEDLVASDIYFCTLSGVGYNGEPSKREIGVKIPEELAEELAAKGFPGIKYAKPNENRKNGFYFMSARWGNWKFPKAATCQLITGKIKREYLKVRNFDRIDESFRSGGIESFDIVVRPRYYDYKGRQGYLLGIDILNVVVRPNRFDKKFGGIPLVNEDTDAGQVDEEPPFRY